MKETEENYVPKAKAIFERLHLNEGSALIPSLNLEEPTIQARLYILGWLKGTGPQNNCDTVA